MKVIKLQDMLNLEHDNAKIDGLNGLIGEVTISKYGSDGSLIYTKRDHNRIVLPGSLFVLEQMFKPSSRDSSQNKNIPLSVSTPITGAGTVVLADAWTAPSDFGSEKVFGFIVGNGGANSSGVITTTYNKTTLLNSSGANSMIPFRVVATTATAPTGYKYKARSGGYDFYYIKGFDTNYEPSINISSGNTSCYASMRMTLTAEEFKEYFTLSGQSASVINQIGLVAGYYNTTKGRYDDVRMITQINFSSLDIIGDSSYTIEYVIYSK